MEYVKLGKSDLKVSKICLGTWQLGSKEWGWGKGYYKDDAIEAVSRALDLGVNFMDTAEIYGQGASERILGEAIRRRRNEVVIATKVAPWHLRYESVVKAADRSLARLGVSEIDLYQIHFPNPLIPIRSTIRAMEKLVHDGKVRYIGVSNFSVKRLKQAQEAAQSSEIVSNQVKYSLIERKIVDDGLLQYSKENSISILAYSPLAQGVLAERSASSSIQLMNILFSPENHRRLEPLLQTMRSVASERGKTVSEVALNWLLKDENVIPIVGVKRKSHVEQNAGAIGWKLTQEEIGRIDDAFSHFKKERFRSYLWMLPRLVSRG
ncbi:MAG: aldo/keto reductase [Thaumarchaeota archaeon]|nr:aldo/keto reductase [Nitrososphaerota archaeon]